MIVAKCSMHLGKKWSIKHNKRDYDKDKWNKDGHIDESRSQLNKELTYTPLNKFFDETFGDALVAFNDKNYEKHPDRLIGFKNAAEYKKATPKERRERAVKAYCNEQKKNVQEGIFQLGDHEEYMQLVQQVGQQKADKIHADYLEGVYKKFVEDNPSLKVFSAVIHMDEVRDGTPHLHLDFIPVAESSRGLTTKVSMEGALKTLGFKRSKDQKYMESPYRQWLSDRRATIEDWAQDFSNKHKVGIVIMPSEKSKAPHEQPQDYKARQHRVKASKGKLAELTGKDKKMQLEAAEYIIGNAKAITENLTKQFMVEHQKSAEDIIAAQQISASAQMHKEAAERARRKAQELIEANRRKATEIDKYIEQAVIEATAAQDQRIKKLENENKALKAKLQKDHHK